MSARFSTAELGFSGTPGIMVLDGREGHTLNSTCIKSEELRDILCAQTGKWDFDDIDETELSGVRDICVRARMFSGRPTDINLRELVYLDGLESLMFVAFKLDDTILSILRKLPRLRSITFSQCDLGSCRDLSGIRPLDTLVVSGCHNMGDLKLPRASMIVLEGEALSLKSIDLHTLRDLRLYHCVVSDVCDLRAYPGIKRVTIAEAELFASTTGYGMSMRQLRVEDLNVARGTLVEQLDELEYLGTCAHDYTSDW